MTESFCTAELGFQFQALTWNSSSAQRNDSPIPLPTRKTPTHHNRPRSFLIDHAP